MTANRNPNFAAYARTLGTTPDQLTPGPKVNGAFTAWIACQWAAFTAETGVTQTTPGWADTFSAWLQEPAS